LPACRKFACAVIALLMSLSVTGSADTVQKTRKTHAKKTTEQAPLPPYTPHTLSALPLDQMPAVPPQVDYSGGQLTIVAHNSTLGDILRAVHKQTGAELDIPSTATERVVMTLGPGPARDVLAALLNGTHFNYVMLGTAADPTAVQRVVLTAKTGPETTTASAGPVPQQMPMPTNRFQQQMAVPQPQNAESDPQADDNSTDSQDDNSAEAADDQQQPEQPNPGQQTPKTPEQLLMELQRQQQQLQQQQQPGQQGQPQIVYPNQPAQPESQN